jgi:hypothetical protein
MNKALHIIPRILAVSLVSFFVFFVLAAHGFTMTAFIESSIALMLLGATMIAWGSHVSGGLIFILLGLAYWYSALYNNVARGTILFISGPLILTGVLFIADKYYNKKKAAVKSKARKKKKKKKK